MSGQRDISLYAGHATPSTIILRALPVATVATTTIYLYEGHATPSTVILRDPTALAETGGAQAYTLTANPGALTLAGAVATFAVARRLEALPGALVLAGATATFSVARVLEALPGALTLTGGDATLTYTDGATAAPVGGGPGTRRRHYVIGDKHVIVDSRTDIETVIAALAAMDVEVAPAKVVRAKPPELVADVVAEPPVGMAINWAVVDALLRQSIRLAQPEVVNVIRAMQRMREDDDEIIMLLTIH